MTAIGNHGGLKKKKPLIAAHVVVESTMTIASRISERKAPLRRGGRKYGAGPPGPAVPGAPADPGSARSSKRHARSPRVLAAMVLLIRSSNSDWSRRPSAEGPP